MNTNENETQPSRHSRLFRRSFTRAALTAVCAFGVMVGGCDTGGDATPNAQNVAADVSHVRVATPAVDRDLAQIEETGTLRVMLRNSSASYYVLRGEEFGFEYELAADVARKLGLRLQVVLPDSQRSALSMLNLGRVDMVAAPFLPDETPIADVAWTVPYNAVRQVLVVNDANANDILRVEDLAGRMVAVRHFSSEERTLFALRREGVAVGIVMHPPDVSTEEVLDLVADGTYPAALAHDNEVEALLRLRPELSVAFTLSDSKPVSWAIRSNSPELRGAVDRALERHYRVRDDQTIARSAYYNLIHKKYHTDEGTLRRREEDPFRYARTGRLSPYDELLKESALEVGLDWRLLAAVAFQESRFDPEAVSWAGAVGLMQIMPNFFDTSEDSLKIPEVNVPTGARHLRDLYNVYRFLDESTRLAFTLAAYNCGQGHLDDARMLSIMRGRDPNIWKGSVDESLLLLRKPQYHRQVRYGYVRGTETVAYVRKVTQRYDLLLQLTRERRTPPMTAQSTVAARGATD